MLLHLRLLVPDHNDFIPHDSTLKSDLFAEMMSLHNYLEQIEEERVYILTTRWRGEPDNFESYRLERMRTDDYIQITDPYDTNHKITVLQLAAIANRADVIEILLNNEDIRINETSNSETGENTALHFATKFHNVDALRALLENSDINPRMVNISNQTPLDFILKYTSASYSAVDVEKNTLLSETDGNTKLHRAILSMNSRDSIEDQFKRIEKIELDLLSAKNQKGLTPLQLAAIKNLHITFDLLPGKKMIDVTFCQEISKAIQLAAKFGSLEVVEGFLKDFDYFKFEYNDKEELKSKLETIRNARLLISCVDGLDNLYSCTYDDDSGFIKRLEILQELDVDDPDLEDQTRIKVLNLAKHAPLELCIFKNQTSAAITYMDAGPCIAMLRETIECPYVWSCSEIAEMYFKAALENNLETIALHSLANVAVGDLSIFSHVLSIFCSCDDTTTREHHEHLIIWNKRINLIYEESEFGETLLEKCILNGHLEFAKVLLQKGMGKPPIDVLFRVLELPEKLYKKYELNFFEKAFQMLMRENCENEFHSKNGRTLLHTAVHRNKIDAIRFLASHARVDVNKRVLDNADDSAPLHLAVIDDNFEAVKILMENSANDNLRFCCPMYQKPVTPFEMAIKRSEDYPIQVDIAHLLSKRDIAKSLKIAADMLAVETYLHYNHITLMNRLLKTYFESDEILSSEITHETIFDDLLYECFKRREFESAENLLRAGARPKNGALCFLVECSVEEPHRIEEMKRIYRLVVKYAANFCREKSMKIILPISKIQKASLAISDLLNEQVFIEFKTDDHATHYNEYSLIEYMCSMQAYDMIDEILNTESVYKLSLGNTIIYSVTNLVPETCWAKKEVKKTTTKFLVDNNSVYPIKDTESGDTKASVGTENKKVDNNFHIVKRDEDYESDCDEEDNIKYDFMNINKVTFRTVGHLRSPSGKSFLQLLIETSNSEESDFRLAELLTKEPFRALTDGYFSTYWKFNLFLLLLHILYMSLFTVYLTPTNGGWRNNSTSNNSYCVTTNWSAFNLYHSRASTRVFCLVIWFFYPIVIIVQEMIELVLIMLTLNKTKTQTYIVWNQMRDNWYDYQLEKYDGTDRFKAFTNYYFVKLNILSCVFTEMWETFTKHFSSVFSLLFASLAIAWLAIYFSPSCVSISLFVRMTQAVVVAGWIDTLNYLSLISNSVNRLLIMLRRIFAKEFPTFLFVYIFFYLGFGFSIKLFNILDSESETNQGFTDLIFPSMFGISNFAQDITSIFSIESGDFTLEKGFIYVYIGITFLVLSNLLIAMINQSYTEINQVSEIHTRNLRLQLIKKSLLLSKLIPSSLEKFNVVFFRYIKCNTCLFYNFETMQYDLYIPPKTVPRKREMSNSDVLKSYIDASANQIMQQVDARTNNLEAKIDLILEKSKTSNARKNWNTASKAIMKFGDKS